MAERRHQLHVRCQRPDESGRHQSDPCRTSPIDGVSLGNVSMSCSAPAASRSSPIRTAACRSICCSRTASPPARCNRSTVNDKGRIVGSYSNGRSIDLARNHAGEFQRRELPQAHRRRRLRGDRRVRRGDSTTPSGKIVGQLARRLEHRHRRRIHQADRDAAGLFGEHARDLDQQPDGAGSAQHAAVGGRSRRARQSRGPIDVAYPRRLARRRPACGRRRPGLSLVAGNVANADTPGYVRKIGQPAKRPARATSASACAPIGVNRELDIYLQRQLRDGVVRRRLCRPEAQFYERLQSIYGAPGSASSLEIAVTTTSPMRCRRCTANPADYSARAGVVGAAQVLAQQINGLSNKIQALRSDAELGIADAVRSANDALNRIAQINQRTRGSQHQRRRRGDIARSARLVSRPARAS